MSEDTNTTPTESDAPLIRVGQTLYKVLQYSYAGNRPSTIEHDLNSWGLKGWEIASVTEVPLEHNYYQHGLSGVKNYNFQTTIYLKYTLGKGVPIVNMDNYKWFLNYADDCMDKLEKLQHQAATPTNE